MPVNNTRPHLIRLRKFQQNLIILSFMHFLKSPLQRQSFFIIAYPGNISLKTLFEHKDYSYRKYSCNRNSSALTEFFTRLNPKKHWLFMLHL